MSSAMFQVCPLLFQEMVIEWLKAMSAEWESEVDGAIVERTPHVEDLVMDLGERVFVMMATKVMTEMKMEEDGEHESDSESDGGYDNVCSFLRERKDCVVGWCPQ